MSNRHSLRHSIRTLALAAALGAATTMPAMAAGPGSTTNLDTWANDTATRYEGRIPRDIYLDEMGRRWDANPNRLGTRDLYLNDLRSQWDTADPNRSGLSPAEVSRLTGNVDSSTSGVPRSGSGVQPGNMGPASSKAQ